MSRPLRIQYPDAWYHLMNQGRQREEVYIDKGDYIAFIALLHEVSEVFNVCIAAYCLMSNHLLIQTPDGYLSRCMRHINGVYIQRFNRRHGHDGPYSGAL
ncbi:MAG: transposase [Desulfobacteraceae bacterium]|nr:transposase [Desulfobacteraceae bacterium]